MKQSLEDLEERMVLLTEEMKAMLRVPYALRHVPTSTISSLLPYSRSPRPGDIVLAQVEKIGKNTRLELAPGRGCDLRVGDLLAVTFGNRYATEQFEGYAQSNDDCCDLLSMGGVCGLVKSKHDSVAEPSKLRVLGSLGDAQGQPLHLRDFAVAADNGVERPFVIVVCGSAMDSGKTHTAVNLIVGLRRQQQRVASIKLTGTATGRDLWKAMDAGACVALDFVDGGYASTYLCSLSDLLDLHHRLVSHAASRGSDWVVIEIADGLLQRETSQLLQSSAFRETVDAWVYATNDPLGAVGGVSVLRGWGITPAAISGLLTASPLAIRETNAATGVRCLTAEQLANGLLNDHLQELASQAD
jgi:hypothetical protein